MLLKHYSQTPFALNRLLVEQMPSAREPEVAQFADVWTDTKAILSSGEMTFLKMFNASRVM